TSVVFVPAYDLLASGGEDGTVKLWNVSTGELIRRLNVQDRGRYPRRTLHIATNLTGTMLAAAHDWGTIRVWELPSGNVVSTLNVAGPPSRGPNSLTFDPTGRKLAVASGEKTIMLLDAATGRPEQIIEGPTDGLHDG